MLSLASMSCSVLLPLEDERGHIVLMFCRIPSTNIFAAFKANLFEQVFCRRFVVVSWIISERNKISSSIAALRRCGHQPYWPSVNTILYSKHISRSFGSQFFQSLCVGPIVFDGGVKSF